MIAWSDLPPWIAIALSFGALLRAHFGARSKEVDLRIGVLTSKLDLVEDRVTIVENDLKHLPDKETTHRLELSIAEMRTEMRGLSEKMKPLGAIADRIQDAVMEKVMG